MWIVNLIKAPPSSVYKPEYFPRKFHYLKDAKDCVESIKRMGGKAEIARNKRTQTA